MKKIYVLIKENEAIFGFEWFEQCKNIVESHRNMKYRSFSYQEDNEKSLIDALQEARIYAQDEGVAEIPTLMELVEDYILYYDLEDEQKVEDFIKGLQDDEAQERRKQRRRAFHNNSLRVNDLIKMVIRKKNSINQRYFTGYDPVVFYFLLIEMHRKPEESVFYIHAAVNDIPMKEAYENQDVSQRTIDMTNLQSEKEYQALTERMHGTFRMREEDYMELRDRTERLIIETYKDNELREALPETIAFKQWIRTGGWALDDVYHELVTNPIYRKRLLSVGGSWQNRDLVQEDTKVSASKNLNALVDESMELRSALMEKVIGQDTVINQFEKAYFNAEKKMAANERKKGPKQVYLFAGSPGVGKTFLAETFAETIKLPYKRFDMAAYGGRNALEGLVGFEKTYREATEGALTSFVYRNPKCVLLFDEIEKAHPQVILNFLQILDDGHCIDKKLDINVSFQDAILIFTTNAGKQLYEGANNKDLSSLSSKKILDALVKDINPETKEPYFPAAIASRMSSYTVLMFNHLKAADIIKVAEKDIQNMSKMNARKFGFRMTGMDKLAPTILFSLGGRADARNASKKAGQFMDHELYRFLSLSNKRNIATEKIKGLKWSVDLEQASDEVKEIYQGYKDGVIACFTDYLVEPSLVLEHNKVKLLVTNDKDAFIRIVENEDVLLAVIDFTYGVNSKKRLSIADCRSIGREVYEYVKEENPQLDVFFLEKSNALFTKQDKKELLLKDVSGFLKCEGEQISREAVEEIYQNVSYQKTMEKMFVRHQVLSFDTEHFLNEHNGIGEIKLCNLQLQTVIDAEDENEFIGSDVMPNVHWDDIRVSEKLKDELKFFVDYLKNPKEFKRKGLKTPKGVLFYGPPGTGKTSLAKVVATESGINFIAVGADELKNGGPQKVEALFQTARKYAPTVLFIDEIDAIGLDRSLTGMNSALNRLLIEMDGFKKMDDKPVFVMAATNLGNDIDPALGRRFDKKVEVPLPDKKDRKWLFEFFMRKHKNAFLEVSEAQIDALVVRSRNLSPAEIEKVIENAYREAVRQNIKVDDVILDDVFEQTLHGEAKKDVKLTDLKQTAIHEAGHVICDYISSGNIPNYMTIIGRGDFGGYMIPGENEKEHLSKRDFLNKICTSLGGRAAEIIFYEDEGLSPGISQDIRSATYYAQNMVCSWAMYGDEVGLSVIPLEQLHFYTKANEVVNRILAEQMQRALDIVQEHKAVVEKLVEEILSSAGKSLTEKEITEIIEK